MALYERLKGGVVRVGLSAGGAHGQERVATVSSSGDAS